MACIYSCQFGSSREEFDKSLEEMRKAFEDQIKKEKHLVVYYPIERQTNQTAIKKIKERYRPFHTDHGEYDKSVLWLFEDKDTAEKAAKAVKNCKVDWVTLDGVLV